MADINLGHATAYGYAKSKGYTGTEEEFAQIMMNWTNIPEDITNAVDDWLDAHPEATTTVQDGSLTESKFSNALKLATIKDYVTPQMFGAVGDGVEDDTTALSNTITYAFTNKKPILITKNTTIKITSPITLTGTICLIIEGVLLADGCDAIKVLSVRNRIAGNGTIKGTGTNIGVLFGGENKTNYSNYNIIEGVNIDSFDIGISLYNDQQGGLTVYFDIITNLNINHCRIGIGFYGYADAILVSKIIFTDCGSNDATGGAFVFRNIGTQYPLDNSISQIFHHSSANAITLNIEKVSYSSFSGIVSEQGGANAKSLVITDNSCTGNTFYLISNVAGYRTVPSECYARNIFNDIGGKIEAGSISIYGDLSASKNLSFSGSKEYKKISLHNRYVKTGIAENTNVELFTVSKVQIYSPIIFKIRCIIASEVYAGALRKYAEGIVFYSGISSSDVVVLQNFGNRDIVTTTAGVVTVNSGNNGTGTTKGFMLVDIEQITDNRTMSNTLRYTVGDGFEEM